MREYRICSVGGGPAGCSTVETIMRLYPEGVVDLYERSRTGKRECGEALGKYGKELLQLPPKCVARNVEKVFVRMGYIEKLRNIPGYMIDRAELNKYLIQKVKSRGCNARINCEVVGVRRNNKRWKVKVRDLKNKTEFSEEYDLLIAADGAPSIIAMYAGVVTREERERWMRNHAFAFQYKLKTGNGHQEELYFEFPPLENPNVVPIEYFYLFHHHEDLINVGCVYNPKYINRSEITLQLKEFEKNMGIKRRRIVKKMGGFIPLGGPLPITHSNGVLVVGDAAGQTGTIFGEGITRAAIGGKIAGEIGAKALQAGDLSKEALSEYEKWRGILGSDLLLEGKRVSRKIRANQPVSTDELKIFDKALDNIKVYW